MTAPRPAVAPRPVRRTAPTAPARPSLRLVPPARDQTRIRLVLVLSTAVVFAVMLLAAVVHTTIVAGQRELDRVDERIAETTRQNQSLRLEVAELGSPERIVESATADGMVVPEDVTWLAPGTPPSDQATTGSTTPSDPAAAEDQVDDQRAEAGGADPDPGGAAG